MTSLPCNTVCKDVQFLYLRAVFRAIFEGGVLTLPPLWWGGEERGEILLLILSALSDDAKETFDQHIALDVNH